MNLKTAYSYAAVTLVGLVNCVAAEALWQKTIEQELPLLGHRNWIVIVDAAYPWQVSPGVETIATDAEQIAVIETVLAALAKTTHVRPIIFTDAELAHITEQEAKGITAYRTALARVLSGRPVQSVAHEQIIAKLDEAGKTFHVLLLKTKLTLPYTSVFLQLDCGYWSADAEKQLRAELAKASR
jgi:D-ribose pyranose/furanose isomerase RbsD